MNNAVISHSNHMTNTITIITRMS